MDSAAPNNFYLSARACVGEFLHAPRVELLSLLEINEEQSLFIQSSLQQRDSVLHFGRGFQEEKERLPGCPDGSLWPEEGGGKLTSSRAFYVTG